MSLNVNLSIKKAQWGLHQNMELGDEVTNICTSGFLGYGKGLRFPGVMVHGFTCKVTHPSPARQNQSL